MLSLIVPLPVTSVLGTMLVALTMFTASPQVNKEENLPPAPPLVAETVYAPAETVAEQVSEQEVSLLARVVYAEARGEPYIGQVAVAAVVLNRVRHPDFPGTIHGVIFEPRAFCSVTAGLPEPEIPALIHKAVRVALAGIDPTNGALYFYNPDNARCRWIRTREKIVGIGRHVFAK